MLLRIMRSSMATAAIMASVGAFACGGRSNNPVGPSHGESSGSDGTSSGAGASGSGQLTVKITDSPFADAKAVLITFDSISVHHSDAGWETVRFANGRTERTCDLKKLDGPTDVLGSEALPAGHYTQIRLNVTKATIHFDNASTSATACAPSITVPGTRFAEVRVPSGEVKLNRQFTLDAGAIVTMVLDFDGDKSIRQQGGGGNGNGNGNNGNGNGNAAATGAPENGSYSLQPVVSIVSVSGQ